MFVVTSYPGLVLSQAFPATTTDHLNWQRYANANLKCSPNVVSNISPAAFGAFRDRHD